MKLVINLFKIIISLFLIIPYSLLKDSNNLRNSKFKDAFLAYDSLQSQIHNLTSQINLYSQISNNFNNTGKDNKLKSYRNELHLKENYMLKMLNETVESFEEFLFNFPKNIKNKIKSKNKKSSFHNPSTFYNCLTMVMMALLTGGLVGVLFILYNSSKAD